MMWNSVAGDFSSCWFVEVKPRSHEWIFSLECAGLEASILIWVTIATPSAAYLGGGLGWVRAFSSCIKSPPRRQSRICTRTNQSKMTSLTPRDKEAVKAFWAKVSKSSDDIGANALSR